MFVKGRIWFPLGCPQRRPLTRLMQPRPPSLRFFARLSLVLQHRGSVGTRRYVKIIIMQPQIKSPRFINTSSLSGNYWDQHQLPPRKMYESNIFLERFFVVSIKQVGFLFIRINIFTLALQQNRFFCPGLYFDLFNICSQTKSILPFISYFYIFCFWRT